MVQQHQASHDSVEQSQVYTQVVLPPPLPANKQLLTSNFASMKSVMVYNWKNPTQLNQIIQKSESAVMIKKN